MHQKVSVLGVKISLVNENSVIAEILELVKTKKRIQIVTPNPEHLIQAQKNPAFKKVLNQADVAVPDGVGVVWALKKQESGIKNHESRNQKRIIVERVTGVDLMLKLCRLAEDKKWVVGLLGGTSGVATQTTQLLLDQLPSLQVVVLPYEFAADTTQLNKELAQTIATKKIEVLFVALGAPKQELFIANYIKDMGKLKIAMGVGGAFDVISGRLKRPPEYIQKMGLEWLFRLVQEPWRWKRQTRLLEFMGRVWLSK